jgi:quinol monooxygenase YgiN
MVIHMILIIAKHRVKPEYVAEFPDLVRPFTEASRAEEGNIFFTWLRSVEDPLEFVLIEAFLDEAGEAHVNSPHFAAALETLRPVLSATPEVISRRVEGQGWDLMGELRID